MTFSSIIIDYLGEGAAASRPAAPNVAPSALALYFATDTGALSAYDVGTAAWVQILPENAWGVGTVTALGTISGGVTLQNNSHTLQALGGWTAGAVTALGTVAGGATLAASGGTLTATIPPSATEWNAGSVTALGTVFGGVTLEVPGGTLVAAVPQNTLYTINIDLVTTAPLSPANTYVNGTAGVGATLTGAMNGNPTVDGSGIAAGTLILVNNEAAAAHNGIYVATQPGSGSTPYVLTRVPGFDNSTALAYAAAVAGGSGTANFYTTWLSGNPLPFTIGTGGLTWVQSVAPGSAGVAISGNDISVNWNAPAVSTLGTIANGATVGIVGGALRVTGGWAAGAISALGTVAGGVTLSAAGGTLQTSGGWSIGNATTLAGSMSLNSGTLTNEAQGTLTLSGTTTGTVSPIAGFNSYLVNVGTAAGTISIASGSIRGQEMRLDIKQGATAHTVAFDGSVIFGTDITSYTATTNAGSIDMVKLIWGGSEWRFAAVNHGFAS